MPTHYSEYVYVVWMKLIFELVVVSFVVLRQGLQLASVGLELDM